MLLFFWSHVLVAESKFAMFVVDEDMDELEEELKSLLDESKPDSLSGLPEVPTGGLQPSGEPGLPGAELLSALPAVPHGLLNVSAEQLEEELNQLTLTDSGVCFLSFPGLFVCFFSCRTVLCCEVMYGHLSVQTRSRRKRQSRDWRRHSDVLNWQV